MVCNYTRTPLDSGAKTHEDTQARSRNYKVFFVSSWQNILQDTCVVTMVL